MFTRRHLAASDPPEDLGSAPPAFSAWCSRLEALVRWLVAELDAQERVVEYSRAERRVIEVFTIDNDMSLKVLLEAAGMTMSQASHTVQRLAEHAPIARRIVPDNHRALTLTIAPAGRNAVLDALPVLDSLIQSHLAKFDHAELAACLQMLGSCLNQSDLRSSVSSCRQTACG